jgi:hypothetical protein
MDGKHPAFYPLRADEKSEAANRSLVVVFSLQPFLLRGFLDWRWVA